MQGDWQLFSPDDDAHYFFGYYDRCPWDLSDRRHLALKVAQGDRLPVVGERAAIGLLDREDPGVFPLPEEERNTRKKQAWLLCCIIMY